jgi:hypothetical protein
VFPLQYTDALQGIALAILGVLGFLQGRDLRALRRRILELEARCRLNR